jgi:hypothetical protein
MHAAAGVRLRHATVGHPVGHRPDYHAGQHARPDHIAARPDADDDRFVRVTGNKIVRFLIMTGINVRFVSVRRVGVSAWQEG